MDMYQKRKIRQEKKNSESNQESFPKTSINWYPGHMVKTRREIKEKLSVVDLIYEVVDARMPISSKIVDIDDIIKSKPRILIMTKYDVCDKPVTDSIAVHYKDKGYKIVKVNLLNDNISELINMTNEISENINAERRTKGMKDRPIRVLVIGTPNVGKSTLINKIVGKKKTITGNKPGVTKQLSWIRVGKNIELLDSPGILWPKLENQEYAYNMAAFSSIKDEIIDIEDLSIYILDKLVKFYPKYLVNRYGIQMEDNIEGMLNTIGKKRGAYIKGGDIDYDKVYRIIIKDLRDGLIGNVTFDRI